MADSGIPAGGHTGRSEHAPLIFRLYQVLTRVPVLLAECLVRGYQVALSPLLIGHCKFCPSCSDYCIGAIREWGVLRGGWLGLRRLLRCHPFSPGGIDPVPRRDRPGDHAPHNTPA